MQKTANASHKLGVAQILLLGLSAVAVAILLAPPSLLSVRLVWNVTPSAPSGLYWIDTGVWHVGDRVAVRPSALLSEDLERRAVLPRGKLLIKRIAAGRGDTVCRDGANVTINGSLSAIARSLSDSRKSLPGWLGCRPLDENHVFLLGDTPDSYDGRYFGVTSAHEVVGRVVMLLPF